MLVLITFYQRPRYFVMQLFMSLHCWFNWENFTPNPSRRRAPAVSYITSSMKEKFICALISEIRGTKYHSWHFAAVKQHAHSPVSVSIISPKYISIYVTVKEKFLSFATWLIDANTIVLWNASAEIRQRYMYQQTIYQEDICNFVFLKMLEICIKSQLGLSLLALRFEC